MSKMPEEVKQAFETLKKYQYKDNFGMWSGFNGLENYQECEFRLRPSKPLTAEEAKRHAQQWLDDNKERLEK